MPKHTEMNRNSKRTETDKQTHTHSGCERYVTLNLCLYLQDMVGCKMLGIVNKQHLVRNVDLAVNCDHFECGY